VLDNSPATDPKTPACQGNFYLIKDGFFEDIIRVPFDSLVRDRGIVNFQDPVAQLIYDMLGRQTYTQWSRVESGQMDTNDYRLAAKLLRTFALLGHSQQIHHGASNAALRQIFALDLGQQGVRDTNLELARLVDRQLRLFKSATDAQGDNNPWLTPFRNNAAEIMQAVERKDLATATHIFLSMEGEINALEATGGDENLDARYVHILLGTRDMVHSYLTILWENGQVDHLPKKPTYDVN
jgi:hypothetical protein